MMSQRDLLHSRVLSNSHCVFHWAMSPADLGRILLGSVLRIMDKEIRAIDEDSVSLILPRDLALASRQYPRIRFVITRIDDGYPVGLQSIAERECGMVEVMSR